jgi:glutamate 5-kinase
VNYSATDLARIAGKQSSEIEAILGIDYDDEIIHRNNLVLI